MKWNDVYIRYLSKGAKMSNHCKPKKYQDQFHRAKPTKNHKNPAEEYLPFIVRPDRVSA